MQRAVYIVPRPRQPLDSSVTRQEVSLTLDLVRPLFCYRQVYAAEMLGISLTSLKSACRRLGIVRWPYTRKRISATSSRSQSPISSSPVANDHMQVVGAENIYDQGAPSSDLPHTERTAHESIPIAELMQPVWQQVTKHHVGSAPGADEACSLRGEQMHLNLPQNQPMPGEAQEPNCSLRTEDDNDARASEQLKTNMNLQHDLHSNRVESMESADRTDSGTAQTTLGEECEMVCTEAEMPIDKEWLAWYMRSEDSSNEF
eukprot:756670-Hanusia_phi.AAC.2